MSSMLNMLLQQGAQANPLLTAGPPPQVASVPPAPRTRLEILRDIHRGAGLKEPWDGYADPEKAAGVARGSSKQQRKNVKIDEDREEYRIHKIAVGGDARPEHASLVLEHHDDGSVAIHSAHADENRARAAAEGHAREFWNDGHQTTPSELSPAWRYRARREWNEAHPEHLVDGDFDFRDKGKLPHDLIAEHKALYMAEYDRPEEFPGLRKANAAQESSAREGRSGVFQVMRHAVVP